MKKKRLLILTGGGDCPGLNTVIRAIVRSAYHHGSWEVLGSKRAFQGILEEPQDIVKLDNYSVAGIHVKGGTILQTSNSGNPFSFPVEDKNGKIKSIDRSNELISKIKKLGIDAVINIGGDGSQKISQQLYEKGLNIIGVPKTIDNDLGATDFTFGFQTAVETATEAVDKLVSTAESHNRIMIAEVMGRDAGWICLYSAVAAGADVALIPEIPYDIDKVVEKLNHRIISNVGFANIVIAEGAMPKGGNVVACRSDEKGYENRMLGGIGYNLMCELKKRLNIGMRVTVLGHVQRGGTPIAFDRILATQFGVKAFEIVNEGLFGQMVAFRGSGFVSVPIKEAIAKYKHITSKDYLLHTARTIGICLGD